MKIANPTTIPIVIGVFSNTAPSNAVNSADYNTGTYIELPAGKWVVNATMLLRNGWLMQLCCLEMEVGYFQVM